MTMELTRKRWTLAAAVLAAVGLLAIYFFLYHPLMRQLKVQAAVCRNLENEVEQARSLIARSKTEGEERPFIKEEEVSLAIDELTKQGKLKGINFISMIPGSLGKSQDSRFRFIPIEIETESTYEALGLFLGTLDDLKASLVTVASFETAPPGPNPSRLRTKLVLHMCVTG